MIIKHNEFYEFKINLSIIILMNFKTLRWVCTVPTVGMHRTHGGYAPYPRWVCTVPTVVPTVVYTHDFKFQKK